MFTAFERPVTARVKIRLVRPLRSLVVSLAGLIAARLIARNPVSFGQP
jgi:hypothetical protein